MPLTRAAAGIVGLIGAVGAVAVAVWPSDPAHVFTTHMVGHMALVSLAAPLIALAVTTPAMDPVRRRPHLWSPLPASIVELIVVWGWHAPTLHEAARRSTMVYLAEQASFLGAGLLLWIAVLGGTADIQRARASHAALALALTFAHMTLLGAALSLAPRPLYHLGHDLGQTALLSDQQWGGSLMIALGAITYLTGLLWVGQRHWTESFGGHTT